MCHIKVCSAQADERICSGPWGPAIIESPWEGGKYGDVEVWIVASPLQLLHSPTPLPFFPLLPFSGQIRTDHLSLFQSQLGSNFSLNKTTGGRAFFFPPPAWICLWCASLSGKQGGGTSKEGGADRETERWREERGKKSRGDISGESLEATPDLNQPMLFLSHPFLAFV